MSLLKALGLKAPESRPFESDDEDALFADPNRMPISQPG
jgi:hypothetical protein